MKTAEAKTTVKVIWLNVRQERFAQALAREASPDEAMAEAGYRADHDSAVKRSRQPAIVARVRELVDAARWGGSGDLAPVIDAMRRLFEESCELNSAAAIKERCAVLVHVARLKALLPYPELTYAPEPPMTRAEWVDMYVPKKV